MPTLVLADGTLTLDLSVLERVAGIHGSKLTLPLAAIDRLVARPAEAAHLYHGLKVGTNIPGVYTAGTFHHLNGTKDFLMFSAAKQTVAIHTKGGGEQYRKIIVQVSKIDGGAAAENGGSKATAPEKGDAADAAAAPAAPAAASAVVDPDAVVRCIVAAMKNAGLPPPAIGEDPAAAADSAAAH